MGFLFFLLICLEISRETTGSWVKHWQPATWNSGIDWPVQKWVKQRTSDDQSDVLAPRPLVNPANPVGFIPLRLPFTLLSAPVAILTNTLVDLWAWYRHLLLGKAGIVIRQRKKVSLDVEVVKVNVIENAGDNQ